MTERVNKPIGVTAIKPVERHGWEAVSWFLYDKENGAIMGRTPKSWALITIFYIIYYSLLAAFWALMLVIFFQTIDDKVPRWTTDASIIGSSPALGVRPDQAWERVDSSMIIFNKDQKESDEKDKDKIAGYGQWVDRSDEFLKKYRTSKNGLDCNDGKAPEKGFCKVDLNELGDCGKGNLGYDKGKPCIFVKLNRIYDMVPEYYNDTANLPKKMPAEAVARAKAAKNKNQVWIDCHGENMADREAMGRIRYYPADAGYPSQYYPYLSQDGYLSPLVAVQFLEPPIGQLLHIECRAYAENIGYDRRDKIGKAHFELLVHDKATAAKVDG